MEAPEKIYIHPDIDSREFLRPWLRRSANNESVEYTRTDAFIEKAVKWLETFLCTHYVNEMDNHNVPDDVIIENFENYMKGEKE